MRLKSISLLAAVATVVLATGSFAGQAQPAAPAPAAPTKFVPPVRGEAEVGTQCQPRSPGHGQSRLR